MTFTGANRLTLIRGMALYANLLLFLAHGLARLEVRVWGVAEALRRRHKRVLAHLEGVLARVQLELDEADEE